METRKSMKHYIQKQLIVEATQLPAQSWPGEPPVNEGDYLVIFPDGEIHVMMPEDFLGRFEPLAEDVARKRMKVSNDLVNQVYTVVASRDKGVTVGTVASLLGIPADTVTYILRRRLGEKVRHEGTGRTSRWFNANPPPPPLPELADMFKDLHEQLPVGTDDIDKKMLSLVQDYDGCQHPGLTPVDLAHVLNLEVEDVRARLYPLFLYDYVDPTGPTGDGDVRWRALRQLP